MTDQKIKKIVEKYWLLFIGVLIILYLAYQFGSAIGEAAFNLGF